MRQKYLQTSYSAPAEQFAGCPLHLRVADKSADPSCVNLVSYPVHSFFTLRSFGVEQFRPSLEGGERP